MVFFFFKKIKMQPVQPKKGEDNFVINEEKKPVAR